MAKPKTPTKRKKRRPKKKSPATKAKALESRGPSTVKSSVSSGGGGGGVMQSMRSGFKRAAGVGVEDATNKPSTASNLLWTVLLLGIVAFGLYRWLG